MNHYLWIDLETTGLDPERCGIIEIAAVLTTSDMEVLGEYETLVNTHADWEPGALGMHAKNGLAERWATGDRAAALIAEFGLMNVLSSPGVDRPMLAGSSVHFDRRFIKVNMEQLDRALHYRHLDVSTITEMMISLGYQMPDVGPSDHTAMADIKRSMAIYRHWREVVELIGRLSLAREQVERLKNQLSRESEITWGVRCDRDEERERADALAREVAELRSGGLLRRAVRVVREVVR